MVTGSEKKFFRRPKTDVEIVNIFNINSIVLYNDLRVPTNANGEMIGPMPDFKTKSTPTSQESRQIQLGLKFQF